MVAELIDVHPDSSNQAETRRAAQALADGALVAFPTETVYGVAANAANAEVVQRLRDLKGRGTDQPFTVHIGRRSDSADFVPDPTPLGRRLMRKGWPGPLTLVFQVGDPTQTKAHGVLSKPGRESVYQDASVGIRFPDHPVAADLLAGANVPIIATSANLAGEEPPTDAASIGEELAGKIDLILDGGPTRYRRSSTIVAVNGDGYRLVRPGVLDERTIHRLATVTVLFVCTGNTCRSPMAEGLFKQMVARKLGCSVDDLTNRGIIIRSAGTLGINGGRASREAIEVSGSRGIDISGHASHGLTVDLIRQASYIYTMGNHHRDVVRSLSPQDAGRALPLDPDEDIADPIGGTLDDYARVADKIAGALQKRIQEVSL